MYLRISRQPIICLQLLSYKVFNTYFSFILFQCGCKNIFRKIKRKKNCPQKVEKTTSKSCLLMAVFFLCSPACPKQPRSSFPFYKFSYTFICAKICGMLLQKRFLTIVLCIDPFIKIERRVTYSMIESLIMTQFELRARLTQLNFSILISIYNHDSLCYVFRIM